MLTLRRGLVVYLSKGSAKCLVTVAMGSTLIFFTTAPPVTQRAETYTTMFEEAVQQFLNDTDVPRLSRNLRSLLLHYQTVVTDGHPFDMQDLLTDLLPLFELLDEFEKT